MRASPRSVDVPELWMPVSEVPDLLYRLSCHTVVSLAQITLSVLPLAVKDSKGSQKAHAYLATQVDSVAGWGTWAHHWKCMSCSCISMKT